MAELFEQSAVELLALLDRGEASSVEVVESLHRRADAVNGAVNALVHEFRAEASERARRADEARAQGETWGPLHGLPVTLKESIGTKGLASTLGLRGREGKLEAEDAVVVHHLQEAGAIILGKTNVPQTLLAPMETTNFLWGTTNNPWNLERSSGGSSGGEAAALAAGMSVLGVGTDLGGSIRTPAAFCGVAGLKPTLDRWSNVGSNTAVVGQEVVRSQIGPMARTVADVELLFRSLAPENQTWSDPRVAPAPVPPSRAEDLSALTIGVYEDDGFLTPAASVRRAVRDAAKALADRGATVVPYHPPDAADVVYLFFAAISSDGGASIRRYLDAEPVIPPLRTLVRTARWPGAVRGTMAVTLGAMGEERLGKLLGMIGKKPVTELWALTARRTAARMEEMARWNDQSLDAVLCPVHATTACPHGMSHDFTLGFCYSSRYNLLDMPALTVPVSRVRADETEREALTDRLDRRAAQIEAASEGLPIAVQVVGRPWCEHVVLCVGRALEESVAGTPGHPRTPVNPSSGEG